MILLAKTVKLPPGAEPVVFTVHYLENKIERLSMISYVHYLTLQRRRASIDSDD